MHWNYKSLSSIALNNATTFQNGRGSDDKRGITVESKAIGGNKRQCLKLAMRHILENRSSESAWSLVLSGLEGTLQSNNCGDGGVREVHRALHHRRELKNLNAVVGEDLRLHVRLRIRVVVVHLVFQIVVVFGEVFLRIGVFVVVVVLLLLVLLVAPTDLRISLALPPSSSIIYQKKETKREIKRIVVMRGEIVGIGSIGLALEE